jgi:hypothetical protein
MRSRPRLVFLAAVLVASLGCGTRYTREPVYTDDFAKVLLRAELREGEPVPRGFAHPATISAVRLAHILAQIDVRVSTGDAGQSERRPAIHQDLVYPLGERLSEALAKAGPDQEVLVEVVRVERRLGLFTQRYVTSFLAWVAADDLLYLSLSRLDWPVPKGSEEEALREPKVGREVMAFRTLASEGVDPVGHQLVAVDWRDERFRRPTSVHVGPGGKMTRRTILMQEEAPEEAPLAPHSLPSDPDALRALAELEEERRAGAVTEAEYQRRKREILRGAAQ